jgi:hypothetical protein
MKKFLIASGVAVMAFASIAAAATFNANLTVGSTGAEVMDLQTFLLGKGYVIPSISSGAASKGYFGSQTKTAVMKYQADHGIPNTGFVGPLTRAALNSNAGIVMTGTTGTTGFVCPIGMTCTVNPGSTVPSTPSTGGSEGQLTDFDTIGGVESTVDENDEDQKVLGVEFDAEDSDMTIDRVDVDFTHSSGTASDDLSDYITEVSLWLNDKKLGSMDVDDADEDNDVYSFRFSGLKGVVKDGDTSELYVAVTGVNNVDTSDTDGVITVGIPENGIRATDTAGITDTYVSSTEGADVSNGATNGDLEESFLVGAATVGDLDISESDASPEAGIIVVDANDETEDVVLFAFEVEADNENVIIEDVPVNFLVTTATNVDDVISGVALVEGTKTLKSKSIPSSAGTYEKITFDNLNLTVKDGETRTFLVVATVLSTGDDLNAGDTIIASTTGSDSAWDAEDANGETITPDGSAEGDTQTFFESGIMATFISADEDRNNGTIAGDPDSVDYTIVFDIKAIGDDAVYIDGETVAGTSTPQVSTDGLSWASTTDSTTATSTSGNTAIGTATLSATGDTSNDVTTSGAQEFKIKNNQTRRFTFKVTIPAGGDNVNAGVRITGIKWDTNTGDSTANLYNFDLSDFKTDTISGLMIR